MVTRKAKYPVAQDLGRKTCIVGATSCGTGYRSDPVPPNNVIAVCDRIYMLAIVGKTLTPNLFKPSGDNP